MRYKNKPLSVILNIFFIIMCVICIYPVLMALGASFTSEASLVKDGYRVIPKVFSLDSYKYVFGTSNAILRAYAITIVVTAASVLLGVLVSAMYAYVIGRKDFEYRTVFSFISFFTMLFSGGLVASYLINTKVLNLSNTIWALILPGTIGAWNVIVLKSFFQGSVPYEIIESGKLDGADEFKIFFKLVMPISLPGIATIALFIMIAKWNDWLAPMLYITNNKLYTLSFLLQNMMNNIQEMMNNAAESGVASQMENLPTEGARMALCMVAVAPMLVAYPFFQKYFIQGMTVGSVKG
mgnify:FL=1